MNLENVGKPIGQEQIAQTSPGFSSKVKNWFKEQYDSVTNKATGDLSAKGLQDLTARISGAATGKDVKVEEKTALEGTSDAQSKSGEERIKNYSERSLGQRLGSMHNNSIKLIVRGAIFGGVKIADFAKALGRGVADKIGGGQVEKETKTAEVTLEGISNSEKNSKVVEQVLSGLCDGSANVERKGNELVIQLGDGKAMNFSDLVPMLRDVKIEDQAVIQKFAEKFGVKLKEDRAPELHQGKFEGTNMQRNVSKHELTAVTAYTTLLFSAINPMLRGNLEAYGDRNGGRWITSVPNSEKGPFSNEVLSSIIANTIVASSTLNKLPNFESAHNVSQTNPQGYVFRGLRDIPPDLKDKLVQCAKSRSPDGKVFKDSAFVSAGWEKIPSGLLRHKTKDPEKCADSVQIFIESKTGTSIMHTSEMAKEREILFAPGTEFEVTSMKVDKESGNLIFYMKELPRK